MITNLNIDKLGFEGSLKWVYNREGSGAKFYNSSVYYPDKLVNPKSKSGITIDPGLDLGNANPKICDEVINFYAAGGLLFPRQITMLKWSYGLKRERAIDWIKKCRSFFKGKFLVSDELALHVMALYTAPKYWQPLITFMPKLQEITPFPVKQAVHTALLSLSYNMGPAKAESISTKFIDKEDYEGLANAIRSIKHNLDSLNERRQAEASLIEYAIESQIPFDKIINDTMILNPMPLEILQEISL